MFAAPAFAVYVIFFLSFPLPPSLTLLYELTKISRKINSAFFWIGWSSFPYVSIASPIIALTLLGASILFIFLGCFNYLIDTYLVNAASCLSINSGLLPSFSLGGHLIDGTFAWFSRMSIDSWSGISSLRRTDVQSARRSRSLFTSR